MFERSVIRSCPQTHLFSTHVPYMAMGVVANDAMIVMPSMATTTTGVAIL